MFNLPVWPSSWQLAVNDPGNVAAQMYTAQAIEAAIQRANRNLQIEELLKNDEGLRELKQAAIDAEGKYQMWLELKLSDQDNQNINR